MSGVLEAPFTPTDSNDLAGRLERAGEQIEQAVEACAAAAPPLERTMPDVLVVGGMGGSAIAADLTAALHGDRLPRPMVTVRELRWPAWVDERCLAVLCSFSGGTAETLALYDEAGERGVPRVAMTTGGELEARCRRDGVPVLPIRADPPPRAAMTASWVAHTYLLHALGWIEDPAPAWRAVAAMLRERNAHWAPSVPEASNAAKLAARELHGRLPFIYASSERLGAVATRLRNQLNENAKLLAHSAVAPELNHNEIVGWEKAQLPAQQLGLVVLRDCDDAPEVRVHLDFTQRFVTEHGVPVVAFEETQGERLERMMAAVHWGDCLSFYLAMLNEADPTPIRSIDALKARLAEWRAERV